MGTLTITLCFMTFCLAFTWSIKNEKSLTRRLTEDYRRRGKDGRPMFNSNSTLNVEFGLALLHIMDVDYDSQTLEMIVWNNMNWMDEYLKWNPSEYGGVDAVSFASKHIFVPDITAYNSASKPEWLMDENRVVVWHNGQVSFVPPVKQKFLCLLPIKGMSIKYNKEITCTMKYGSWTYNGSKMNLTLQNTKIDTSFYIESPNWELVSSKAERHVKHYECCPEPYIDITFDVTLKKKMEFV